MPGDGKSHPVTQATSPKMPNRGEARTGWIAAEEIHHSNGAIKGIDHAALAKLAGAYGWDDFDLVLIAVPPGTGKEISDTMTKRQRVL